ncbi:MAG: alkaline phosphatase [Lewinella sp.]|nr:alkaline phosphatase [Lewinella sp.]
MWRKIAYGGLVLVGLLGCTRPAQDLWMEQVPVEEVLEQPPRNVILMIGSGMGLTEISAGLYRNHNDLNLARFPMTGMQKNTSLDAIAADDAAAATAISTGRKTFNGVIATLSDTIPLPTLFEMVRRDQRQALGLVSMGALTEPTLAAFVAHVPYKDQYEAIAAAYPAAGVDLLIGGGETYFTNRTDGRDLVSEWRVKGYEVMDWAAPASRQITPDAQRPVVYFTHQDGAEDSELAEASALACQFLRRRQPAEGFFLVIDGSGIAAGGSDNDGEEVLAGMLDFDRAVGEVLDFAQADGETLVVVTGDREVGGFSINQGSSMDTLVPAFTTQETTAAMIPVFAYGPGADLFGGIYDNTRIFWKLAAALAIDLP